MNSFFNLPGTGVLGLLFFQLVVNIILYFELKEKLGQTNFFADFVRISIRLPEELKREQSIHELKQIGISLENNDNMVYPIEQIVNLSKWCRVIIVFQWITIFATSGVALFLFFSYIFNENLIPEFFRNNLTLLCSLLIILIDVALVFIRAQGNLLNIICMGDKKYKKIKPYQVVLCLYYFIKEK